MPSFLQSEITLLILLCQFSDTGYRLFPLRPYSATRSCYIGKPNSKMSCIQQNFPSKFEPNDAFYEKLEENTFVAFILKHPVW